MQNKGGLVCYHIATLSRRTACNGSKLRATQGASSTENIEGGKI